MNYPSIVPTAILVVGATVLVSACSTQSERTTQPGGSAEPTLTAPADSGTALSQSDTGRDEVVRILTGATTVETFRIRGHPDYRDWKRRSDPRFKDRFIGAFPIDTKGPVMDREFAEDIAGFLLDEGNFVPRGSPQNTCVFDPGVAFRVQDRGDRADVIICFTCGELTVDSTKGSLRLPSSDFSPGYSRLSALAKKAFPNDKQIQALR